EDFFVAEATLALEESAGDLAGRERLLDVLAGEGEEIETRAFVATDGGDEDDAVAVGDEDGPVRLLGKTARLEGHRTAVDHHGLANETHEDCAPWRDFSKGRCEPSFL